MSESDNVKEGETLRASTPNGETASTSKETGTYTGEQAKKLVIDALAEQGRKHKKELDSFQSKTTSLEKQIAIKETQLANVTAEREEAQNRVDELASDDPDKFNAVKKLREAKELEQKAKDKLREAEDLEETNRERIKRVEDREREDTMRDMVKEYENGNFNKLVDLCETVGAVSDEQIRKVADTLWEKTKEPQNPVIEPFSSVTEGGAESSETKKLKKLYPNTTF